MFDQAQLRKGTLEGCILKIIDREPTYGYAIATTLRDSGFADLTEGRAGSGGPSRKYYQLTPDGETYLQEFTAAWRAASAAVNHILQGEED